MALLNGAGTRLAVQYLDDTIVMSARDAWTYMRLPLTSYEFLSYGAREAICEQITLALASLSTSSQDPIEVHLRVTHHPIDTNQWANDLNDRVVKWNPTSGWNNYLNKMARHVQAMNFDGKEVYLGVKLGVRRSGSEGGMLGELMAPIKKITDFLEGVAGMDDPVSNYKEIEEWHKQAKDVHRALSKSHLKAVPATSEEIARLISKPLWPEMVQPDPTSSPAKVWGRGEVRSLVEGVITHERKWVEVEQIDARGTPLVGYSVTLAFSRFPDVLHFPDREPWMHFAAALAFPVDFSSRMEIVPPQKVQKDVGKKLADAKDQAMHIAQSGVAVPLKVREQLEVATVLEYTIDKDRAPWAYARHRMTITGQTVEEVTGRAKTIIEAYRELGIDVVWPSGDQLDLMCESMPGDRVRGSSYYQRQELAVVAGGMPTASSNTGDKVEGGGGWVGPYLGYTTSRVVTPVFFSPHVAMARNRPPGVAITGAPGGGKALALGTQIPTPTGWSDIADLQIGDQVFDETGKPCNIVDVSPVFTDHDCYRVVFDDGSEVIADGDHQWTVEEGRHRQRVTRERYRKRVTWGNETMCIRLEEALRTTSDSEMLSPKGAVKAIAGGPGETMWRAAAQDLVDAGVVPVPGILIKGAHPKGQFFPSRLLVAATLTRARALRNDQRPDLGLTTLTTRDMAKSYEQSDGRREYAVPVSGALKTETKNLRIHPYLLGVWLSHGTSQNGEITTADPEVLEAFADLGYTCTPRHEGPTGKGAAQSYGIDKDFGRILSRIGVLNDKHLPMEYLRASEEQRWDLFAGICDGDSTVDMDGGQEFCVTNERLANGFYELLMSLGIKASLRVDPASITRTDGTRDVVGERYRIKFTHHRGPALTRLPREGATRATARRRYIVAIEKVDTVPTRCISVDSPNHLYLAGKSMIPTHNSFSAFTLAHQMALQGIWTIYIDPKADAKPMGLLQGLGNPRVFDLRDGNDGMLDPFSLGTTPSESTLLALETMRLLLGGTVSEEREEALLNAVQKVTTMPDPSLSKVVDILMANQASTGARNLGAVLNTIRDLPFARLCFSPTGGNALRPEDGLTVVTLLGLDLPSASTKPEDYSYENRLAVSVMYLLTRYARSLMLNLDKSHPKAICIDEAWAITSTPQGAKLIPEIARMGRSHNTALVLVSQNAGDLMAESVTNSLSTKLAFRSNIPGEINDVLELFGLEKDQGYQSAVRDLRNGECLMQDLDGRVSRVQIDAWDTELFDTFNTNPETRGKTGGQATGSS